MNVDSRGINLDPCIIRFLNFRDSWRLWTSNEYVVTVVALFISYGKRNEKRMKQQRTGNPVMFNLENYFYIHMIDDFFLLSILCQLTVILPLFIEFHDFDHALAGDSQLKGVSVSQNRRTLWVYTSLCWGTFGSMSGSENGLAFTIFLLFVSLWGLGCYCSLSSSQGHYCFNYHSYDYYYFAGHNVFGCTCSRCVPSLCHSVFIAFHSYHCCSRKRTR